MNERHRRGARPPWWPEGEDFPAHGRPSWPLRRRRFGRRVGLLLVALFGLVFLADAAAVAVLSGVFGVGRHRGLGPLAAIVGLGLLLSFVVLGRAVRRMAGPIADVMEAADRVAAGNHEARVEERGSRETRRLARSFNAMTERLRANEDNRRNLLADVAHELRTPMSVIQGNVEGMLDGLYPLDPKHLEPVLEETKVMSRLLDDLQTLSTAEAGALRLHREPVAAAHLVEDAVAAFRQVADEAGAVLEARVGPGLPPLNVDPVRIGQVLANLLSNAVRHTDRGGSVVVSVGPDGDGAGVAFSVSDTGSGIPPEVLPHVFDRFVRAGDSKGAGLGLAIARSLVVAHGGEIRAESPQGGGTILRFVLPLR